MTTKQLKYLIESLEETLCQYQEVFALVKKSRSKSARTEILISHYMQYGLCHFWETSIDPRLRHLKYVFGEFTYYGYDEGVDLANVISSTNREYRIVEDGYYLGGIKCYEAPVKAMKVRIVFLETFIRELKKELK